MYGGEGQCVYNSPHMEHFFTGQTYTADVRRAFLLKFFALPGRRGLWRPKT